MPLVQKELTHGFLLRLAPDTKLDDEKTEINFHYIRYVTPPKKRVLTFKGGGVRVFVYEKFIEIAHLLGFLAGIKEIGGSSSGTIGAIFSAVHYENPLDRNQTFENLHETDYFDIMGDSPGWQYFQIVSKPMHLISKPLLWAGSALGSIGDECNQTLPGKLLGYPLKTGATLLTVAGNLLSPTGIAGAFNLFAHGGIFRGKILHQGICEQLQLAVQQGLDSILTQITDPQLHQKISAHLIEINLCEMQDKQLTVLPDITFKHFFELSKLPGSQFKELFITGTRIKDKKLLVFNRRNSPDFPVHEAASIAMALPQFYPPQRFRGNKCVDGGILDNSPGRLATPRPVDAIQAAHGITDNHARLMVRVEYPDDLENHLWHQPKPRGLFSQLISKIQRKSMQLFTFGIDTFASDDASTLSMQNDFSHNTLQMEDFHLGRLEPNLTHEKRADYLDQSTDRILAYFDNHANEVAVIQHFLPPTENPPEEKIHPRDPQIMPSRYLTELLEVLEDYEQYPTQDLFDFATARSFTEAELARLNVLRLKEINRIKNLPAFKAELRSTIKVMHLMESQIQPDSKSLNLDEVTPSKEEAKLTVEPPFVNTSEQNLRLRHNKPF